MSYTDDDVELVALTVFHHEWRGGDETWGELKPVDQESYRSLSRSVLGVLAREGRLLPPDAEVRWSVGYDEGRVDDQMFSEEEARCRAAEVGADVVRQRVGPWEKVTDHG